MGNCDDFHGRLLVLDTEQATPAWCSPQLMQNNFTGKNFCSLDLGKSPWTSLNLQREFWDPSPSLNLCFASWPQVVGFYCSYHSVLLHGRSNVKWTLTSLFLGRCEWASLHIGHWWWTKEMILPKSSLVSQWVLGWLMQVWVKDYFRRLDSSKGAASLKTLPWPLLWSLFPCYYILII